MRLLFLWIGLVIGSLILMDFFILYLDTYRRMGGRPPAKLGRIGELIWPTAGPGTILPLPRHSGMFQMVTESYSLLDYFFVLLILRTNLIFHLWWMFGGLTMYSMWMIFRLLKKKGLILNETS